MDTRACGPKCGKYGKYGKYALIAGSLFSFIFIAHKYNNC
jgi:hypothetical protein